jgi:Tol biopolymer transport system component
MGEQTLVLAPDDNWSSPRRTFSGLVGAISPHGGQRTWEFSTGDGTQLFTGRFDHPDEATVVDQTQYGSFQIFGFARGGSRFLYWKTDEEGADVWSGPLDVYMAGGSRPVNTGLASLPGYDNSMMSLSPTANTLAAVVGEDHITTYDKSIALLDISSDTSLTQQKITGPLVSAIYPAWSPDGKDLAWSQGPDSNALDRQLRAGGERRIWLAGDRGLGAQKQLTNDSQYADEAPVWSRDGKYILFGRTDQEEKRTLWLMRADGSGARELAGLPDTYTPRDGPALYLSWPSLFDWSFR